ncbi:cleft lip and palate transmembrane protein 1-like protein [Orussus abietinus]|uniref:cleft lip and palate transmembrane protein 1-like protein n=1 Tax=Orussus abietinus TaxID=222816 RepID=UPI0006254071|nr:cleft lip and palate transmembrane protein 1-like protein [Orussus abietinus]
MKWLSFSFILSIAFLIYISYSIYILSLLFVPPPCEVGKPCLTSYLSKNPHLQLHIYSSVTVPPLRHESYPVFTISNFDYHRRQEISITLDIPQKTQQNGTLFLYIVLAPKSTKLDKSFYDAQKKLTMSHAIIKMVQHVVPEASVFQLLGTENEKTKTKKENVLKPIAHLKRRVTFTVMTDDIKLPAHNLPLELRNDIKVTPDGLFLPIVNYDFLQTKLSDLEQIKPVNHPMNVTVFYAPISLGKLRLVLHVEAAMQELKELGFSEKDIDEVKRIFAETNLYLLAGTVFIAATHILFDFLAFKNDINFWKNKNNLAGLSVRTVLWRAFSQTIILLYLLDEGSSLLILVPSGIGTIIELWKSKKILRIEFTRGNGVLPKIKICKHESDPAERKTREFDAESMRYLSYVLYPLISGGAIYSLLYQPHKSWWSWTINSLVNGVYAFGFLFMLPQLFVNYKLKSVAHLPWRAFMYKAFNTFIDDIFAFIITMPTAHRVACFRDDAVFLIYLYQRWLYPVDKTRIDTACIEEDVPDRSSDKKKN